MTIYKFRPLNEDKKENVVKDFPKDTAPLSDSEAGSQRTVVLITRANPSRRCINFILAFVALLVFAAGLIGGVYLYKHLTEKHAVGRCGVDVYDELKPQTESFYFEEEIEIREDYYEEIRVPQFEDCDDALVLHDFAMNYTAIVDVKRDRCFTTPLNRTAVSPPRDMFELVRRLEANYYVPKAMLHRERYHVLVPAIRDVRKFGPIIAKKCRGYDTYALEKMTGTVMVKRSAKETVHYMYYGNKGLVTRMDINME